MKKKTLTLFALVLALVLSFSLAIMAGWKKGNSVSGDGTAVSLVTDESLQGKLLAMYTFEDSDSTLKATDPYTGEALEANNGTYGENARRVAIPAEHGSSTAIFDTSTYFSVGGFDATQIDDQFEDYTVVDGNEYDGLSFSFWAYNYETLVGEVESLGESADWSNVMTNGYESITWGNLSHMQAGTADGSYRAFYPSNGTEVGRGAYTEEGYNALRNIQATKTRLSTYSGTNERYSVWNAISGNTQGEGSTDNDYIPVVAAAYLNTWRYVTINIDLEEGLSFYANGRLAYRYDPDTFNTPGGWNQIYADFVMSVMAEYQESDDYYLNMFGSESGIYVDDLIVGKSLTADDACNLYENVSGTIWTDADLTITSLLDQSQENEQEAIAAAKQAWLDNYTSTQAITSGRQNFYENLNTYTAKASDSTGSITYTDNTATFSGGDSKNKYVATDGANGYTIKISGYHIGSVSEEDVVNRTDELYYYNMQTSLWNNPNDANGYIMNTDMRGYAWINPGGSGTFTGDGALNWPTADYIGSNSITDLNRYSWVEIELKWDGTSESVSLTYYIYYAFYSEIMNCQESYSVTYNGKTFNITDDDALWGTATFTLTKEQLGNSDLATLGMWFFANKETPACFYIINVDGATAVPVSSSTPDPEPEKGKNPLYTYSNEWYSTGKSYAQLILPEGDFDITYTADVYTANTSVWHGPAFIMFAGAIGDNTPGEGGGALIYVRSDDHVGNNKNVSTENKFTIEYTKTAASGAYAYTLGDPLYVSDDVSLCEVIPVKFICNITRTGSTYVVTFYKDSATEENIIRSFTFTFEYSGDQSLILNIGGEATYMENIEITNNTPDGEALTIAGGKTTSGTKTQVSTDGYTPVSQD